MARFVEPQHELFRRLNSSLSFDWRLGPYDVVQSRAHVRMLAERGILEPDDRDALLEALEAVERELDDGTFPFGQADEDIHMAIERRVTELAGPVGGRLHTARSRNDQVATDVAMFVRAHALATRESLGALVVLWSSQEFGFCEVADAFASGSSIMPQKKNPDAAELLRAKAPRVAAHLAALHGVLHGLPLTYNKDMQEDKEHLFDVADTLDLTLAAARGMLEGLRFDREALAAAATDEFLAATDLADLLVRRGIPFRESHGVVAGLVRRALDEGRSLSSFTLGELAEHSPALDGEYYEVRAQGAGLEAKASEGGTALARVREQLAAAHERLSA